MTYRLNELIDLEIGKIYNNMVGLQKRLERLDEIKRKNLLSGTLSMIRDFSKNKPLEDIPAYNSDNERHRAYAKTDLNFVANGRLYLTLRQLNPKGREFPEELCGRISEITEDQREIELQSYVYDYFIQRKADKVAAKLEGYQKTLTETNKDPDLNVFGNAFREAYKRLELELKDTHPAAFDMMPPGWRPEDWDMMDVHPEIRKLHEKYPVEVLRENQEILSMVARKSTEIRRQELEKYATKAKEIRTQEVILDSLTRIYDKYKKGFE